MTLSRHPFTLVVNGDLFSVAIDAMADWVADTLQSQVSH